MISFITTKEDGDLIDKIMDRAVTMYPEIVPLTLSMDITACHTGDHPLNLERLLEADNLNFTHDVLGIYHHINRKTGKLKDFFLPRYAK